MAWRGGVTCILPAETFLFFIFAAINVTLKWSSGLKERVFKAVIFGVIVMYCGYFFHCINYKACCQVDNSGVPRSR